MEIIFHSKHHTLAEDFRDIVRRKLETLSRFNVRIERIEISISHEVNPHFGKSSHHVSLATRGNGPFLKTNGSAFNDLAAFDEAVKSMELQLRKLHDRTKKIDNQSLRTSQPIVQE